MSASSRDSGRTSTNPWSAGQHEQRAGAGERGAQAGEVQVDLRQVAPGLDARCAELVRERVEHRPVRGDIRACPGITHDAGDALDELAETLESGGGGTARVGAGIRGVHEIGGLEGMAVRTHPLEDGLTGEDLPRARRQAS